MKKLKILLAALLVIGSTAKAQVVYGENEKEYIKASSFSNGRTEKKDSKPFLSGQEKYKLSSIGSNWFGSIKAGMSTFSGAPVGCTDFFGHTRPTMVFSLGKWHSRFFGTRLVYQGFKFTNAIDEAPKLPWRLDAQRIEFLQNHLRSTSKMGLGSIYWSWCNSQLRATPYSVCPLIWPTLQLQGNQSLARYRRVGRNQYLPKV